MWSTNQSELKQTDKDRRLVAVSGRNSFDKLFYWRAIRLRHRCTVSPERIRHSQLSAVAWASVEASSREHGDGCALQVEMLQRRGRNLAGTLRKSCSTLCTVRRVRRNCNSPAADDKVGALVPTSDIACVLRLHTSQPHKLLMMFM